MWLHEGLAVTAAGVLVGWASPFLARSDVGGVPLWLTLIARYGGVVSTFGGCLLVQVCTERLGWGY